MKIINKTTLSAEAIDILKNESTILQSLHHPCIVQFRQIFETSDFIMIEMEYIKGGQLKRLFRQTPALTEREVS